MGVSQVGEVSVNTMAPMAGAIMVKRLNGARAPKSKIFRRVD